MIKLKFEYPLQKEDGTFDYRLIKHYAEDENGNKYIVKQNETGIEYEDPVDIFPCPYTYEVTDKLIQTEENNL